MNGEKRKEKMEVSRPRDRSRSELVALRDSLPAESKERQIAEKRIELTDAQHDNTGSWKGEYFARDLQEDFLKRGLEAGPDGKLPVNPEDATTHYLMVNMGELDRVNAIGDHSSGDKALEAAAAGIRDNLRKVLKDDQFDVYRTAGNDFSICLKNVNRETVKKLTHALCGEVDLTKVIGSGERAPIEASSVSRADMIEIINRLKPSERQEFFSDEKPEGMSIGVVKELLQQQNDRQKVDSRMHRMQEMMSSAPEKAEEYYNKYQKKVLGELFREPGDKEALEYKTFVARFKESDPEAKHHLSAQEARRQYASRRDTQRGIDRTLGEYAAKHTLSMSEFSQYEAKSTEISDAERTQEGFEPPKPTRGFALVKEKRAHAEAVKTAGSDPRDSELAELDAEIESAERDPLTGLATRGRLFHQLETGLETGKKISTIYIDLAFLKYFDKEGNSTTGNVAIQKAAEMLDGIAAEASKEGIHVEAYRVGGDEFAFAISGGGPDAAERVKEMLMDRQLNAAPIPLQGEKALGAFYKQKLSFNFGSLGPLDLEGMRTLVKENNVPMHAEPGSKEERNMLAEYAMRFADKQLEIQKGLNRINLLAEEKRAAVVSGDFSRYDQLLKYSQKAIFGAAGQALIDELYKDTEFPEERVLKFVIDQIKIKGAKKETYQDSVDQRIDERVRELYFEQQIEGLQHHVTVLEAQMKKTEGEKAHLEDKVAELQNQIQEILSLKERILNPTS